MSFRGKDPEKRGSNRVKYLKRKCIQPSGLTNADGEEVNSGLDRSERLRRWLAAARPGVAAGDAGGARGVGVPPDPPELFFAVNGDRVGTARREPITEKVRQRYF
jgi:hypothetical protein